jgi:hypothetical protein
LNFSSHQNLDFVLGKLLVQRQKDLVMRARRWHSILGRILPYVNMGDEHVNRGVTAVCTYGWQALTWDRNHSLLHYAATTDNADLAYILIMAQADPNHKDERGRTIWDVAKRENANSVLRTIEKLMHGGFIAGIESMAQPREEIREELEVPPNLSPKLKQSIDMIRSQGSSAFKFSMGTSPMHLAAKDDRGDVVAYLWYMQCDLHQVDKNGLSALDHAKKRNCMNALAVILSIASGNPPKKPKAVKVVYHDEDVPLGETRDDATKLDPTGVQISMEQYMREFGADDPTRDDYVENQIREYKQSLRAEQKRVADLERKLEKAEKKAQERKDMQRLANDVPHEQRVFASGLDNRKFDRALNDLKQFGEDATMKVLNIS